MHDAEICGEQNVRCAQELEKRVPDIPCAAPFAAATPGDIILYVQAQAPAPVGLGPLRLLVRCKGEFLADRELRGGSPSCKGRKACRKVKPPTLLRKLCFVHVLRDEVEQCGAASQASASEAKGKGLPCLA